MTAKRNNYDVTKREDGWAATRCGAGRASFIASTQEKAFERAREFCIAGGGGEVSVFGDIAQACMCQEGSLPSTRLGASVTQN